MGHHRAGDAPHHRQGNRARHRHRGSERDGCADRECTGIGTVLDAPELLPPDLDLGYLPGKRVLLVDDVADSGRTLALAVRMLEEAGADVRSVCIYTKPGSVATPDYSWRETDLWINFPWSFQGTVAEEDAGLPASA